MPAVQVVESPYHEIVAVSYDERARLRVKTVKDRTDPRGFETLWNLDPTTRRLRVSESPSHWRVRVHHVLSIVQLSSSLTRLARRVRLSVDIL